MNIEFDEQELWIAVIRQALQDAMSLTLDPALVREARDWFTPTNNNFNEVCDLAGKCPVRTSKGALHLITTHDTKAERVRSYKPVALYTFEGRSLSLKQWGEVTGIHHGLIRNRLYIGWSLERALRQPKLGQAPGVVADLVRTSRDRRGSIAQPFPKIEFSKIKELAE